MNGRVLIIAGSDSGGGAGIQADIKTVTALGAYAATAITAITVQDTEKVHAVHPVPDDVIASQIRVVLEDIGADAIKIGMIGTRSAGEAILAALEAFPDIPLILDPVLVATSGDALGDDSVADLIRASFLPRTRVLTPNVPEAEILSGHKIDGTASFEVAARRLTDFGADGVMAKAGHMTGDQVTDFYYEDGWVFPFRHARQDSTNTHGTGCSLASAIAAGMAQGMSAQEACRRAVAYVSAGIAHAPGLGKGHGPLNHALREKDDSFAPL